MKKTLIGSLVLLVALGLIHALVWPMNTGLHRSLKEQSKSLRSLNEIREIRQSLEIDQNTELNTYKWIDQRKEYAEIPLERAFHYYLKRSDP